MIRPQLPVRAVIFDMDGTLIDSTKIIVQTMYDTFAELLGYQGDPDDFRSFVGPPLEASFATMTDGGREDVMRLIAHYRALYSTRDHQIRPFDGVEDLLRHFSDAGVLMAVATSKLQTAARSLIKELGLDSFFVTVCGAEDSTIAGATKSHIVGRALHQLQAATTDLPLESVVMVGDRKFDVQGAIENRLPCLAADWAHLGQPGEFDKAFAIAKTPAEVPGLLGV